MSEIGMFVDTGVQLEARPRDNNENILDGSSIRSRFREFIRNFRSNNVFHYRDAIVRQWNRRSYFIEVDLAHVKEFDEELLNNILNRPADVLGYLESATKDALKFFMTQESEEMINQPTIPDFQVIFHSNQLCQSLRDLTAEHVSKLIKIPGIITACNKARSKATNICVSCSKCQSVKKIPCKSGFGQASFGKCTDGAASGVDCGTGSYVVMADDCDYFDEQTLKLQESPEVVPTGEMPRSIVLYVDRYLVDRVSPGTRVSILGVSSLMNSGAKRKYQTSNEIRTGYIKVLGIQLEYDGGGRSTTTFTPQEEEEMLRLSRDPNIYEKIARSIAPQISGDYTIDIKKAIALLLLGGSRKILPDGVRLRGDINILLMGDPSTAKSQFLKFVERVAPIGVYTSGKGSSAAGLTASVIKDSKGEFFLEGGAMVLADGGVICIDEFDKMRETDRVAIHEAMEQQTISIAKAGITTVLNCRASVLAAANPISGRYDDLKSVGDNIDLMSTILSRFDCIFIVRDVRDPERDRDIARHVLGVHINSSISESTQANNNELSASTLKKYISYCRERCAPRLNDEATAMLSSNYVQIRNDIRTNLDETGEGQVVPITIRQLEALIRMAEALAKMRLSAEGTPADVNEALRLFRVSTLAASKSNPAIMHALGGTGSTQEVTKAEEFLKRRLGLRMSTSAKKIVEEAQAQGYAVDAIKRGIIAMIMRNELQELNQGKILRRIR